MHWNMGGYLSSPSTSPARGHSTAGASGVAGGVRDQVGNNNIHDAVIIPIDASQQAETAFEWYLHFVHRPGNIVHVIHCQEIEHPDGSSYPDYAVPPEAFQEQLEKAKHSGNSLMAKYNKKLEERGIPGHVHGEVGRPGEVIIKAVDRYNAGMVVMGTRGFGIVRRTILGSVSEYVVHHSKVPVTVIPKETQSWFF